MIPRSDEDATDRIDRALRRGVSVFRFPGAHEAEYRRDALAEQRRAVALAMLVSLALFDSFVINDWAMLRDSLAVYLVGKFLFVTPACLACRWAAIRSDRLYNGALALYPVVVAAGLSAMLWWSTGAYRTNYLSADVLIMVGGIALIRPRWPYAVASLAAQCACFEVVVFATDLLPRDGRVVSCLFCLCGALVSMLTAYTLETADRRAFLLKLRAQTLNRHLREMTLIDPLTGLGNRRALDEASRRHWSVAGPLRSVSLVMIDIDHFKLFNDSFGHAAGDLCLERIARTVRGETRPGEVAIRFGGEEIAVLLPNIGPAQARARAERIRWAILREAIPHPVVAPGAIVTASLGVASGFTGECTLGELVGRADRSLYAAKQNGRDQVRIDAPLAA